MTSVAQLHRPDRKAAGRVGLGPEHPDYGRDDAVLAGKPTRRGATREERTRTCAICEQPFVVSSIGSKQEYCGQSCGSRGPRAPRKPRSPAPGPKARPIACPSCGQEFRPDDRHRATCSWTCEMRAAAGHLLTSCPCLSCSTKRAELGMPPLIKADGSTP